MVTEDSIKGVLKTWILTTMENIHEIIQLEFCTTGQKLVKHIQTLPACILNDCRSLFIYTNRLRKPSAGEVRSTSFYGQGLENSTERNVDVSVNLVSM